MKDTRASVARRPHEVDVPVENPSVPRQRRLPRSATGILAYVGRLTRRFGPGVWPSVETLAAEVGCCTRTVQLQLRRLADVGLLVIVPDPSSPVGRRFFLGTPAPAPRGICAQESHEVVTVSSSPCSPATTTTPLPEIKRESNPDQAEAEAALSWWLTTPKARGVRNPAGFRRVALARGVDASIVEAWRASRMPQDRPSPRGRVPVDPEAERAEAASVAAFLAAAKSDPSSPLFSVMRRRAGV
jgi:hypothetical protein